MPAPSETRSFSKAEEIALLEKFTASLPPASTYSGKWLSIVVPLIIRDIQCDLFPEQVDHREAHRQCHRIMEKCYEEKEEIIRKTREQAKREADSVIKDAQRMANEILDAARAKIKRLIQELHDV